MKKKILIGVGVLAVILIAVLVIRPRLTSNKQAQEIEEDPLAIEYFTVAGMDQVFVNGVVKPEQSQEFRKEEALGIMGDLKVKNGDSVEKDTLLYTYENTEAAGQIEDLNNQVARMETQKANAAYKLNLAIKNWKAQPEEERTGTLEEIRMDMSTDDLDAEIKELYGNIKSLKAQRYKNVLAPFKGKVYIPEEKDAESAILKLISDNFYVSGIVNEKDVEKLAVNQVADIKVISNDYTVTGKVNFIDLNPAEDNGGEGYYSEQSSSMSTYPVKLSLDTLEGIRNGYHVQAIINIGDNIISIPTPAIHSEGEINYVLVNDFGTIVRRVIQIGEEQGDMTGITSGLEAEDLIIVSSKEPIQEGQMLDQGMESEDIEAIDDLEDTDLIQEKE